MINRLSYPRELIAMEKALSEIPSLSLAKKDFPDRRLDLLCFAKKANPNSSLY
jgi:hypothetical protein